MERAELKIGNLKLKIKNQIARHSRTDRNGLEAQKCISSIPAGSEQYSNLKLRRFPFVNFTPFMVQKSAPISVHLRQSKKMTNEPNFNISQIAVSNLSKTDYCSQMTVDCEKNEPKRSQSQQRSGASHPIAYASMERGFTLYFTGTENLTIIIRRHQENGNELLNYRTLICVE